jgi:hypothetical protein
MNEQDASDYRSHLHRLNDDQLSAETKEAIRQRVPLMMQLCYNEWRNRDSAQKFLTVYNSVIKPEPIIDHEFR